MIRLGHAGVVLLALLFHSKVHGEIPLLDWKLGHPTLTGQKLFSVAHGPAGFVVTGLPREILVSSNGFDWKNVTRGIPQEIDIGPVTLWRGEYVMPNGRKGYSHSADGVHWETTRLVQDFQPGLFVEGDNKYVIFGRNRTMLISSNGSDWQRLTAPTDFLSVAFGNGVWVGVSGDEYTHTSADLLEWTLSATEQARGLSFNHIQFGNERFVIFADGPYGGPDGGVFVSVDGKTWNYSPGSPGASRFGGCVFARNQFVGVNADSIFNSTDGLNWTTVLYFELGASLDQIFAIAAADDGTAVAVGPYGTMFATTNSVSWQPLATYPRDFVNAIAGANGKFVAVGGKSADRYIPYLATSIALFSQNGAEWISTLPDQGRQFFGATYGNGLWLICGETGLIFTSPDGLSWTNRSLKGGLEIHHLLRPVFGNGRFVLFSYYRNVTLSSTNAIDWVVTDNPYANEMTRVRFLNEGFIAASYLGKVLHSQDGVNWAAQNLPGNPSLRTIAFGKGRYIAAGDKVVVISLDGIEWKTFQTPYVMYDMEFCDGWFLALTDKGFCFSRDGIVWELLAPTYLNNLGITSVAFSDGVLVGAGGISLFQGSLADPNGFRQKLRHLFPAQLEFFGANGFDYELQTSPDLINWISEPNPRAGTDDFLIWERPALDGASSFWRIKEVSR